MSPCGRAKQLVVFRRRQCAPLLQLIILEPVSSLRTQIRDVPAAKESLLETDSMDGDSDVGGKLIQRAPRSHGQLRAAVPSDRIARYLYRLYKLLDDIHPRWVPCTRGRWMHMHAGYTRQFVCCHSSSYIYWTLPCSSCSSMKLAGLASTAQTSRPSSAWRRSCTSKRSFNRRKKREGEREKEKESFGRLIADSDRCV